MNCHHCKSCTWNIFWVERGQRLLMREEPMKTYFTKTPKGYISDAQEVNWWIANFTVLSTGLSNSSVDAVSSEIHRPPAASSEHEASNRQLELTACCSNITALLTTHNLSCSKAPSTAEMLRCFNSPAHNIQHLLTIATLEFKITGLLCYTLETDATLTPLKIKNIP